MKSYKIVEDEDEDEELIEAAVDDDVMTTYMGMVDLLKNNLKRNINKTKDEDLYIECRFIFGSAARAEKLFSHCKYIKTETRNRLTPQLFEAITFLKSNRELWENSQQLISRTISMSKMENFRAYKRIEEDETEEKRMHGDNN